MAVNRRGFISTVVDALAFSGCFSAAKMAKNPEPKFIWSRLAHFEVNPRMYVPLEAQGPSMSEKWLTRCRANHIRSDKPSWGRLSNALVKVGRNQMVVPGAIDS